MFMTKSDRRGAPSSFPKVSNLIWGDPFEGGSTRVTALKGPSVCLQYDEE